MNSYLSSIVIFITHIRHQEIESLISAATLYLKSSGYSFVKSLPFRMINKKQHKISCPLLPNDRDVYMISTLDNVVPNDQLDACASIAILRHGDEFWMNGA